MTDEKLILSPGLKRAITTQARNLLFEYKYGVTDEFRKRGFVPVEHVQKLLELHGELIAQEIWTALQNRPPYASGGLIEKDRSDLPFVGERTLL